MVLVIREFYACICMVKDTISSKPFPHPFYHICGGYFCKQIIILQIIQCMLFLIHQTKHCLKNNISITNASIAYTCIVIPALIITIFSIIIIQPTKRPLIVYYNGWNDTTYHTPEGSLQPFFLWSRKFH